MWLCIGVDVGGTNTDAVILKKNEVLSSAKVPTTADVTSGITGAIHSALKELPKEFQPNPAEYVARVNIGTTHFVNAIVQRKGLTKVAVLRLCGPATVAIPPLCDFPADLRRAIGSMHFFLNGGYQYDCSCITDVDEDEVKRVAKEVHTAGKMPVHQMPTQQHQSNPGFPYLAKNILFRVTLLSSRQYFECFYLQF